jgi:hypothetical protein
MTPDDGIASNNDRGVLPRSQQSPSSHFTYHHHPKHLADTDERTATYRQ